MTSISREFKADSTCTLVAPTKSGTTTSIISDELTCGASCAGDAGDAGDAGVAGDANAAEDAGVADDKAGEGR